MGLRKVLINDTSNYHNGCKIVVEAIRQTYGYDKAYHTQDILDIDFTQYDEVIVNGEGTMHHNQRRAISFLEALKSAQKFGLRTRLINTVWQEMIHDYDDVLQKCDEVIVREVHSYNEMQKHGVTPKIAPDMSYQVDVPYREYEHVTAYEGQYWRKEEKHYPDWPVIDIFEQDWTEIVNRLINADLLITGRHHEMYAACKAKCRFLVVPGNTWKNEGLLKTVGVNIPWDVEGVLSGKYDEEYKKLWDYLDAHTPSR